MARCCCEKSIFCIYSETHRYYSFFQKFYPFITFDDFIPDHNLKSADGSGYKRTQVLNMDEAVINHIESVLEITNGKIQGDDGAAALLGMPPSTLRNRMRKLGIAFGKRSS